MRETRQTGVMSLAGDVVEQQAGGMLTKNVILVGFPPVYPA